MRSCVSHFAVAALSVSALGAKADIPTPLSNVHQLSNSDIGPQRVVRTRDVLWPKQPKSTLSPWLEVLTGKWRHAVYSLMPRDARYAPR